jgi:hypothetical protein
MYSEDTKMEFKFCEFHKKWESFAAQIVQNLHLQLLDTNLMLWRHKFHHALQKQHQLAAFRQNH